MARYDGNPAKNGKRQVPDFCTSLPSFLTGVSFGAEFLSFEPAELQRLAKMAATFGGSKVKPGINLTNDAVRPRSQQTHDGIVVFLSWLVIRHLGIRKPAKR
jgi:hypothetical protein